MYKNNYEERGNNIYISFMWILNFVTSVTSWIYHKFSKFVLHLLTGYSEVYRIANRDAFSSKMTNNLLKCILNSKSLSQTKAILNSSSEFDVEVALNTLMNEKKVKFRNQNEELRITSNLRDCFTQLNGRNVVMRVTTALMKTQYDPSNQNHEKMLMDLWRQLCPESPIITRISDQWEIIGFQREDPASDFRGMGILGLSNLHYIVTHYPEQSRRFIERDYVQFGGYPFAITGIQLTDLCQRLLKEHLLDAYFYPLLTFSQSESIDQQALLIYQEFFCTLYMKFNDFWFMKEHKTLLEFPQTFADFETRTRQDLQNTF